MGATGMEAMLTRGQAHTCPAEASARRSPTTAGADLCCRCTTDGNRSARPGIATFHFGTGTGATSTVGETLAGSDPARAGRPHRDADCRHHRPTWDLLRLTRMPAVRVEMGYLSNPGDGAADATRRSATSWPKGILVAVKRLYLLGQDDQPTGTFTFADLLAESTNATRPRHLTPRPCWRFSGRYRRSERAGGARRRLGR